MSRYSGSNGGSNGGDNDYDDDTNIKLKPYAAVRFEPTSATGMKHDEYGQSFITNYQNAEVLDGIVLQREDKPETWNIYSADKFFHLNPEDGLVYENYNDDDGYSGEMSAQDVLSHARVQGHSTSAAGNDYYFTPVGVVIEEAGDIAVNDSVDVETTDDPSIVAGDASMLNSNNSWVRTLAKKMTERGDDIINDNGDDPTPRGEEETNPKYDDFGFLDLDQDVSLRDDLKGRKLELYITRETQSWSDGEESTYTSPNLIDSKTSEHVTIDNGVDESETEDSDADSESEKAAATDGGTATETTDDSDTESPDEPSMPENVPGHLDELLDYAGRNMDDPTGEDIRDFAEDEVENPDDIDWEAAAEEANLRGE